MDAHHDPIRFFHFVRRSGDVGFARLLCLLIRGDPQLRERLDSELRTLPRDPGPEPTGGVRVLDSLITQLGLGTA